MHIWHHAHDLPESHPSGANFGIVLSVWDWIFGTVWWPNREEAPEQQPPQLGFPGMEEYPRSLVARFLVPLTLRRTRAAATVATLVALVGLVGCTYHERLPLPEAPTPEADPAEAESDATSAGSPPESTVTIPDLSDIKAKNRKDYPGVQHVDAATVARWLEDPDAPVLLLDVREQKEYAVSHLPGAVRVDPGASARQLAALIAEQPDGVHVVSYCSVGVRSAILTKRLNEAGHANAVNLNGSIFEWANEDRPLRQGDTPVRQVHPYNRKWGKLLREDMHSYER